MYLLQLVFQPLQELSDVYGQLQSAGAAMVKIASILDEEPEIQDRPGATPLPRIEGDLDIDSIVFAYGKDPVLHGVSFHLAPGACFALVGESGHGKSTLATLIGRHYDPDQGAVRVDGHDLRDVELRSYRRQLGVVLQDPFLFSGTIASNIRFAKPDATDEEVEAAAAAVGVDRVAARLSGGLDHAVREGGAGLSAGERQLISIARALLADPRILVLDEATSNIDRPTEVLIEHALDRLLKGRTSIIIAHRLSTVRRADEILVVENGQIIQRGSERELLTQRRPVPPPRARARGRRAGARGRRLAVRAGCSRTRKATSTTCGSNCAAGALREPAQRLAVAEAAPVRPVGRHRVVRVADEDDPRLERDVLAGDAVRIAARRPSARGSGGRSAARPGAGRSAR